MDPQAEEKLSITATETGTHCAPVATHWKYLCISLASTIAAWVLWQNYSIPGGHQETASPYTTKRRLNSYLLPIGKFSDPRKIVNKEEQLVVPSTTQVESNGASAVPFGHAVEDSSNNKQVLLVAYPTSFSNFIFFNILVPHLSCLDFWFKTLFNF